MGDTAIPRGTKIRLGTVEGDLHGGPHVRIEVDGKLVVIGGARFDGDAEVLGDMECVRLESHGGTISLRGGLVVQGPVRVRDGNLEIEGTLRAGDVDVDRRLGVKGPATAQRVEVGGVLETGPSLDASSVEVGGRFNASGRVHAGRVEVGGQLDVGEVDLDDLEVGGLGSIDGGTIRGHAEVGGRFRASKALTFGELEVGGMADLKSASRGKTIKVGGLFSAHEDLDFDTLEVGGIGSIDGEGRGREVDVGGRFRVTRSLKLTGRLHVGGVIVVGGELTAESLEVGGSVEAQRARIEHGAEIGGHVTTREGMRAERIVLHRRSRARGPLVGDRVELGSRASAETIYGREVVLEDGAEARKIVAESVTVGPGASVGEITFTRSASVDPSAHVAQPPRQVSALDPFPL